MKRYFIVAATLAVYASSTMVACSSEEDPDERDAGIGSALPREPVQPRFCEVGLYGFCKCKDGQEGAKKCNADGSAYEECKLYPDSGPCT